MCCEAAGAPSLALSGVEGYCAAWRDTNDIAAAAAAAMPNLFSWFTDLFLVCPERRLEVVGVVRIFVIHRHGPAILERERHHAAGVRSIACGRVADLQRLADLEDAGHAVGPKRLRTGAGDFPLVHGAVGLLHVE